MAEYIDREVVMKVLNHELVDADTGTPMDFYNIAIKTVRRIIEDIPAADVQPVKHGKNLDIETPSIFTCSVCGWHSWDTYCGDTSEYNYCPNCGTKMDGET